MLVHAKQLDSILCGEGKENPGLLSGEWAALDLFYGLPYEQRARYFEQAVRDPYCSGPFIRAMRAILEAIS